MKVSKSSKSLKGLFFELIRVAIGTQESLSRQPGADEWDELFELAKKQSLVGICFIALQRIGADADEGFARIGMSEDTYFTWMGMAGKIQVQSEIVNQQCMKVQSELLKAGFEACILKGQGVAALYGNLSGFRQSGDIDVWVWPKDKLLKSHTERARYILGYMRGTAEVSHPTYHNASWKVFSDTEVEMHYTPSWMYSPWRNRRLQRWFEEFKVQELKSSRSNDESLKSKALDLRVPSVEFNMVYVLQHIYRHLFGEGIGLRQVMDYYFVLRAKGLNSLNGSKGSSSLNGSSEFKGQLESLGLLRFAQGLLWVILYVFVGDNPSNLSNYQNLLNSLGLTIDEREGRFLLCEMMLAGNFGKYDPRIDRGKKGLWGGFVLHVRRNLHFIGHYPSEVLWCPLWKVWHQLWLRKIR